MKEQIERGVLWICLMLIICPLIFILLVPILTLVYGSGSIDFKNIRKILSEKDL